MTSERGSNAAMSLIVTNARVRTGDPTRPWATALGLRDGRLVAIGVAAEILKLSGPETRVIDARGDTLTLPAAVRVGSNLTVTSEPGAHVTFGSTPER